MTNNDILRRIRYALSLSDDMMIKVFALGGVEISRADVCDYLKKDEDLMFLKINNAKLLQFLDGLIVYKRGPSSEESKRPKEKISNNLVMKKLKIALTLRSEEILEILSLCDVVISKNELSAIFRVEGHSNYRECGDRYLRNFLKGLAIFEEKKRSK